MSFSLTRAQKIEAIASASFTILLLVGESAADTYPTTYPFEKETDKPPALPDVTPIDGPGWNSADNPGGYLARHLTCQPYSEKRVGFTTEEVSVLQENLDYKWPGFWECRAQAYNSWRTGKKYGFHFTKNCTAHPKGKFFDPSMLKTMLSGQSVCPESGCCSYAKGLALLTQARFALNEKKLTNLYSGGGCPSLPKEEVVCAFNIEEWYCVEQYESSDPKKPSNGRKAVAPCRDILWRYFMSCPIIKSSKTLLGENSIILSKWEPPNYYEALSVSQYTSLEGVWKNPDRVCHPYSYYHPEEAAKESNMIPAKIAQTILVSLLLSLFSVRS